MSTPTRVPRGAGRGWGRRSGGVMCGGVGGADMGGRGGWFAGGLRGPEDETGLGRVRGQVAELTARRPIYAG